MSKLESVIGGYLRRFGEQESHALPHFNRTYEHVLSVPVFDEPEDFLCRIFKQCNCDDILVIAVVNTPDNATPQQVVRTRQTLTALQSGTPAVDPLALTSVAVAADRQVRTLIINRTAERAIPTRQGVGLARKIGADIALQLYAKKIVDDPRMFMTDADVRLPAGYFDAIQDDSGTVLYPFRHVANDPVLLAKAQLYELHIRYYAWALRRAGSPYAFPSLGSTIAVHAQAYVKVRGIPKRNAAEDFYFLNKLAKVAPVTVISEPEIEIDSRLSERVPFGTGPALRKMTELQMPYASYNISSFEVLKQTLSRLTDFATHNRWSRVAATEQLLQQLGWQTFMQKARDHYPPGQQRLRMVHEWFDGFRTLRFIHLLRTQFPDQPLVDTLTQHFDEAGFSGSRPAGQPGEPEILLRQIRQSEHGLVLGVGSLLTSRGR